MVYCDYWLILLQIFNEKMLMIQNNALKQLIVKLVLKLSVQEIFFYYYFLGLHTYSMNEVNKCCVKDLLK